MDKAISGDAIVTLTGLEPAVTPAAPVPPVEVDERVLDLDLRQLDLPTLDLSRRVRAPLAPHPSFWRWVEFDPPMRDPATAASVPRKVRCRVCDLTLGVTSDPVDALAIARRHRRELRRAG